MSRTLTISGSVLAQEVEAALVLGEHARAEALASVLPGLAEGPVFLAQRAVDLARTGRRQEAVALAALVRKVGATDGVALGVLAYAYQAMRMRAEWLEASLTAVRLAPKSHYGHAAAFAAMGSLTNPETVLRMLEEWAAGYGFPGAVGRGLAAMWRTFASGPERNMFRYVANVFLTLGDAENAVEAYTVSLDPVDPSDCGERDLVRENHAGIADGYDDNALHRGIVERLLAVAGREARGAALDLCCGTGLAGTHLRERMERLVGVDMTPAMLAHARAKNVYDLLEVAEAAQWLDATPERFDLVFMADAMQYFRDIAPLIRGVGRVLNWGGTFAFSCDPVTDRVGCARSAPGEYAHSRALIRALAAEVGLAELRFEVGSHRAYPGFYCLFGKLAS